MSDIQQRRVKEFTNQVQRFQIFRLWAPETGDKWRPVMWLLRCSAWFGPHSFTHSCRVDPASAWTSSNKIILNDLPGARKSDRFCHYFIFFCGCPTNCESSWLDCDRFRQKYQRILLHIELWNRFVHPCPHKSSYRGSCSKNIHHLTSSIWNIPVCWGLVENHGSIPSSSEFRVWNHPKQSKRWRLFVFSSLCNPETEIPVWEVEAGRNKANQRLQVCVEGRVRASEELPLLEGQSEGGTKAFISSESVCVISINIPDWGSFMTEWRAQNPFNLKQKMKRNTEPCTTAVCSGSF